MRQGMEVHLVEQRTPEWHALRRTKVTASEMATVMGAAKYAPFTWRQLYDIKKGVVQVEETYPMIRGTELEPRIHALYSQRMGEHGDSLVGSRGCILASLDWFSLDEKRLGEFKAPMHGFDTEWAAQAIDEQRPPAYYYPQVQAQLHVSGAELVDFTIYDERRDAIECIPVEPDPAFIEEMVKRASAFHAFLVDNKYPPAMAGDVVELSDKDTVAMVAKYRALKSKVLEATKLVDAAKAELAPVEKALTALAVNSSIICDSLEVQRVVRIGNVDWDALLTAHQIHPKVAEAHRKPSTVYWQVKDKS